MVDAERGQVPEPAQVARPVRDAEHPFLEPLQVALPGPRALAVAAHEIVVAPPVALDGSGVRATGLVDDGHHLALGDQDPVRVGEDDLGIDELLAAAGELRLSELQLRADDPAAKVAALAELLELEPGDGTVEIGNACVRFLPDGPRGRPELYAEIFA